MCDSGVSHLLRAPLNNIALQLQASGLLPAAGKIRQAGRRRQQRRDGCCAMALCCASLCSSLLSFFSRLYQCFCLHIFVAWRPQRHQVAY